MILVRPDIWTAMANGTLVIEPQPLPDHIGPNSVDLHLHPELKVYDNVKWYGEPGGGRRMKTEPLDARKDNPTRDILIPDNGFILQPGELYLGRTVERTYTPEHVPEVGGRSSTGRLGIAVHVTAGKGDVHFEGTWTLEITVVKPVRIYPRMRIAQIWLHTTSSPLSKDQGYNGRYQGQVEPTAYRGHR